MNTNKRLYREDERIPGPSGGHDHDLREDVRYVLSGQPTGWAAMATKVREFDEERIKDTKEDMDTLLVFVRRLRMLLSHTAITVHTYAIHLGWPLFSSSHRLFSRILPTTTSRHRIPNARDIVANPCSHATNVLANV